MSTDGRLLVALLLAAVCFAGAEAHLCNDVFAQARDNLAVKVDIRDGQLRIGKEASFRVYLLNTMDRDIANINLEVRSPQFESAVAPASSWRSFPALRAVKAGGKKEYFEVTLRRKQGVPDGKYALNLHLFNGRNRRMVFKTVDMGEAACIFSLARAGNVKVDGRADRNEWDAAPVCSSFHSYEQRGRYFENTVARPQTRCRVAADEENLYYLVSFQDAAGAQSEEITVHMAPDADETPVELTVDRVSGAVTCSGGTDGVDVKTSPEKDLIEIKVPRALVGVTGGGSLHANFSRTVQQGNRKVTSYWRGNRFSISNAMFYGQFKIAQ